MNWEYFTKDLTTLPELALGAALVYGAVIAYTRIFGLKSFSTMSSYDFAHTVAIGALIASSMATGQPGVLSGILLIGVFFALKYLISHIKLISHRADQLIDNRPLLLMQNGQILHGNLRRARVSEDELRCRLRAANIWQLATVNAVVLETTGELSVLAGHTTSPLDDYIFKGVREV